MLKAKLLVVAVLASAAVLAGGLAGASANATTSALATTATTTTFPSGPAPQNSFLSPSGTHLWVIQYTAHLATEIDLSTRKVSKSFSIVQFPRWSMLSPNGKQLWVVGAGDDVVTVYSAKTGALTHSIAVGDLPDFLTFTPSAKEVWVSNDFGESISVIDTSTYAVTQTIPLSVPWTIVFNKSGSRAYASTETPRGNPDTIAVIDTSTYAVVGSVAGTGNSVMYSTRNADGSRLYFLGQDNPGTLEAYSPTQDKVLALITVGNNPSFATVSPDGSRIYVPNQDSDTVSVIDASTLKIIRTISVPSGSGPRYVTFSKTGKTVYLVNRYTATVSVLSGQEKKSATVVFGGPNPVLNAGNRSILKALKASIPNGAKSVSVSIVGYTNAVPSTSLDLARARAAEAYLKSLGLSASYSLSSGGIKVREAVVTVTYTP